MDQKLKCPWCDEDAFEGEYVDVGVGYQQVTPHFCDNCYSFQIGPYDDKEATGEEKRRGWYKGTRLHEAYEAIADVVHKY